MSILLGTLANTIHKAEQSTLVQIALLICGIAITVIILFRKAGLKLSVPIFIFIALSMIVFFLAAVIRHYEENNNENINKDSGELSKTIGLVSFAGEGSDSGVIEANVTKGKNNFLKGDLLHIDLTFRPVIKNKGNGIFSVYVELNGSLKISGNERDSDAGSYFLNQIIEPSEWPGNISSMQSVEFVTPADNPNFLDPIRLRNETSTPGEGHHQENIANRFIERIEILGAHKLQVYFKKIDLRVE